MKAPAAPAQFKDLTQLAADALGSFVVYATDDYFAEKENLLRSGPAEWVEGKYTDKGKWMDGWESQRRRTPGHDYCVVRLGAPGRVHGVVVDTTHFKGNAPQEVLLEGVAASHTATAAELEQADWQQLLPRTAVKPDVANVLPLESASDRITHVRLHIYPDGGVARLRVYGDAVPEPRTFWRTGTVDLVAIENGGRVVEVSDEFFGPPSNLLLPGRGVNMGDGWETKRRRTPGSDWAVLKLARRGLIDRIELDTHFFKGNAPQATMIEALDEDEIGPDGLKALLREPKGWRTLVGRTPLVQHRRHQLDPDRPMPVTHLRVHIYPHGGVNRLRVYGAAYDTAPEREAVERFNVMPENAAAKLLVSFCGTEAFAQGVLRYRPLTSVRELFAAAEDAWWSLDTKHWLQAFSAHPRLGSTKKGAAQTAKSAAWSKGEQSGLKRASAELQKELKQKNDEYFKKFGFIFIAFATGKSSEEVHELITERLKHSKKTEIELAAVEQMKITRLRIEKWLLSQS